MLYTLTSPNFFRRTKSAAASYCRRYGLHLPIIRDEVDVARLAPFVNVNSDFWLDGNDLAVDGEWRSDLWPNLFLHRLPWAVSGRSRYEDCLKLR